MSGVNEFSGYIAEIEAWRIKRETDLRAPDSWLSLTGLFELKDGEQSIGSDESCDVILPFSAPSHLGTVTFRENQATLHITLDTTDIAVKVDGKTVREAVLVDNDDGYRTPSLATIGSVTFFVHKYGEHYGIRVKDSQNPVIQNFAGCIWYAVKPDYRVPGQFVPHPEAQSIQVNTTVNTLAEYKSPGVVRFELHGQQLQLLATGRTGDKLSVILRDTTAGKETYAAVRFLSVEVDDKNNAVIDFNKTYNPPCAFTPYATCPLPPRMNILPVAIEAGEQYAGADYSHD